MNIVLGRSAVLLGFLACVAGVGTLAYGLVRHRPEHLRNARMYAVLLLAAAVLATGAMEHALITHDFSMAFVAENNSRSTPLLFTITGMWSALEGSILLWGLVLAGYIAAVAFHFRRRATDPLVGWAMLVCFVVAAFFFMLMLGPSNPFRHVAGAIPRDGLGPNPLLQDHPLVAFHPPMLYLGFVGFTVPFAFAVAALITGRVGEGWLTETRRWTLFAWGFLSVGIVLGAWWSYQVLGWGGFWAWDPVENASFLPWLSATAYLHSAMVQERRGILRVWNLSLLMATFSLTILGTFLTRSGVVESVHAFSSSTLGPIILAFFGVVVVVSVTLIAWRGDQLASPGAVRTIKSREGAFLANNLLFAAFAFVVLLGTVFPLLAQAINGQQITVGRPYFDTMTMPIGMALLFFMAIGPVLGWKRSSGELLRRRLLVPAWAGAGVIAVCVLGGVRGVSALVAFGLGTFAGVVAIRKLIESTRLAFKRGAGLAGGLLGRANGGMVVHLGVVFVAVALAASTSFGHRGQFRLNPGQTVEFGGHQIKYLGTSAVSHPNRQSLVAKVQVDHQRLLTPAVSLFGSSTEGIGTPAVDSGLVDDVYLTLVQAPAAHDPGVLLGVVIQPLVIWLWIGGALIGVGTLMAALPERRRRGRDRRRVGGTDVVDGDSPGSGSGVQGTGVGVPVERERPGAAAPSRRDGPDVLVGTRGEG
ncbi:MAG: heme lyase CcmF/NrfE family subunit [Acidimicrobiales bacterium]